MSKKQFAVIGLGRFGSSVARFLSGMKYEVLAIDNNPERVQSLAQIVTQAVTADSTDEETLRALGLRNFDVVVVAIGSDIQASILTTLILKELGVPRLVAKAQNDLHGKVLARIGADRVIYPERDMGLRVAHQLISPNILEHIELSPEYGIVEMEAAPGMIGKNLRELGIRAEFGCSVLAIKTDSRMNISPGAEDVIRKGDVLVIVGRNSDLNRLEKSYGES